MTGKKIDKQKLLKWLDFVINKNECNTIQNPKGFAAFLKKKIREGKFNVAE